jgi:hypothetical protein
MIAFTLPFIFVLTVCESIGKQEWLASMNSAALPWSGVVCYAAVICHNRDRLKQRLCNLPDWAAPPNQFLQDVIKAATGACNIEWDPMDKEGPSIALDFESEQVWMAKARINIHIGYKTLSMAPPFHLD